MTYNIIFTEKAKKEFKKLDKPIKQQIEKFLDKLVNRDDPYTLGSPLEGNLSSFWKFRVGDYRLIAEIQDDLFVVLMLAVGHCRDIYKKSVERLGG
jgi:mRNA interferase RelE/StbE